MNEQIYEQYQPKVLRYLISKVNDYELAQDICADVFVKVYEKLDSFDCSKASLSTWVFTVARNRLIDYYRTRRVTEELPETMEAGGLVEEDVCQRENLAALASALEKLEQRERDIIILRYYNGLTLKKIAEQMNISYAYVKVLQNKALQKLRADLE